MSDISIPGVSSRFNTDQMIERLMEVERVPLTRMEEQLSAFKDQKSYWQELNRSVSRLRDNARSLYSFQNPFLNRRAVSSDENILTASASRDAVEEKKQLVVVQVAAADRFLSSPLTMDYRVPSGSYIFTVGEKSVTLSYKGGSLSDFAAELSRKGNGVVSARVIRDTSQTQVLLVESLKTGAENRLSLDGASLDLALSSGILRKSAQTERSLQFSRETAQAWLKPLSADLVSFSGNGATLKSGGEILFPIRPAVKPDPSLVLEISVQVHSLPVDAGEAAQAPPGPALPETGSIVFQGITITNERSVIELPSWTPPPAPVYVDDLSVLFVSDGSSSLPLPNLEDRPDSQVVTVPLSSFPNPIQAIQARNRNTNREITLTGLRIVDPAARGDYTPVHPVSTAQDSVIRMDGIEIRRGSNTIDDLISGVTLTLVNASEKKVTLSIEPDREAVKEALITFIGNYNRLLADLQILTSRDEAIIDELTYLSDDEREKALEKLGAFQGDTTLTQMKGRLQTIMMNPYTTSAGRDLALLAQIGISTNSGQGGTSGYNAGKLRGYLEINEDLLDNALKTRLPAIRELFGRDSDGDLVVDSGAAYAIDTYVKSFVETGGLFAYRIQGVDSQISSMNTQIASFKARLEEKEASLKRQYGAMEGAIGSLEESSQSIQNLNLQGSNR